MFIVNQIGRKERIVTSFKISKQSKKSRAMNRTNKIKILSAQNLNQLNKYCSDFNGLKNDNQHRCRYCENELQIDKNTGCARSINQLSHLKRQRNLRSHLKLLSLAVVSLLLIGNLRLKSLLAVGQEIAELNTSNQQQAADDDELSKTLDRPSEEETRGGGSTVVQTSQTGADGELDERNREHSMSIWSPDEHHRLTSEEDLDQFAVQKQKQHDDEEMAGASELNHHFISVLNNQSNIVFSNSNSDSASGPTHNDSANQVKQSAVSHNHQQPFSTTFLLGPDQSNDTRTVLSVNWKQTVSHQNGNDKHQQQQYGGHHQQTESSLQQDPNGTVQREMMADSISNKADFNQHSANSQNKQEFKKKKRKKKVPKKLEIKHLSATVGTQTGPARMISYRPKGMTEAPGQVLRLATLSNSSKQSWSEPKQLLVSRGQQQLVMQPSARYLQHVASQQTPKESLATLGSSANSHLIAPGGRFNPPPLSTSDLLSQMSYLDPSTTSSSNNVAGTVTSVSSSSSSQSSSGTAGPFEFKKIAKTNNDNGKQSLVSDFLIASSSHPANEFETTLKQQPQHQQEPIVTHSDTGSSPAIDSHSGLESTSSSSILTPADLSDEDDGDGDQEPFELSGGGGKGGSSLLDEQDEQVRDKQSGPKQQLGQVRNQSGGFELQAQKETGSSANQQQQQQLQQGHQAAQAREPEHELLVGPFKSESEAPATITLSGVVYQKSGSSSSFLESRPAAGSGQEGNSEQNGQQQQQDKLSTSSSSSSSSTKLSNGGQTVASIKLAEQRPQTSDSQVDKYPPRSNWLQSQPAPAQLAASINDILLNFVKNNQEQQLAQTSASNQLDATGGSLEQLGEQPAYLANSGGLRLSAFGPLSAASSLLSNSIISGAGANSFQSTQLDDLLLGLNSAPKLVSGGQLKGVSNLDLSSLATPSGSITSASSLAPEQVWATKKGEKYYLGSALTAAASDSHHSHHHAKHKDKGPIVIVQKDVKPVKYHLMRAYLKLRRLLRPFEATYVFLNDQQTAGYSVKRRQRRSGGRPPAPPPPPPLPGSGQSVQPQQQAAQSNGPLMPMPMPNADAERTGRSS